MRIVVVALCGATLLLGGCAAPAEAPDTASQSAPATSDSEPAPTDGTPAETSEPEEAADAAPPAAAAVPEALRFRARTVDGKPFRGAALVGRPVLLWFWAPWCPTCRSQIPQVQDLASRFGDEVHVLGVGSLDDTDAIAGFARDVDTITHLTDADGTVWRHFGVVEQSSFVLLDAAGARVFEAGYGGADDLDERVADVAG